MKQHTFSLPLMHYLAHRIVNLNEKCKMHWVQNKAISTILIEIITI